MMAQLRLLPFMIGKMIEEDDDHWQRFLLLWDIGSLVNSFEVTQRDTVHLAWLVKMYLSSFKQLYPDVSIIPKMHYLVHLPQQIML